MSLATSLFRVFRSWFQRFARRQVKGNKRSEAAAVAVVTGAPSGSKVVSAGFDMKTEIAKLVDRILEPVGGKVATRDLQPVTEVMRNTFEQFISRPATADTDFKAVALSILGPIQPRLDEVDFARVVDRLRGAMVAFCQGDLAKAAQNHTTAIRQATA